MFEAHDRERSTRCAEVRFEGGEEQFVFDGRVRFEGGGEGSDSVLEAGEGIKRRHFMLDVSEHEVKYAVFTKECVGD
jgi:hypothetical protein